MRILVCEDEPDLRQALVAALQSEGFAVDAAVDGREALRLGLLESYDAVVLDIGLPELDGVSVLRRWREEGLDAPVLILTARGRWSDKLAGFKAGADDYVLKPFEMQEVVLRLRALVRRYAGQSNAILSCGPVTLDTIASEVRVKGTPLHLTPHELRILAYLMHHQGRVVSRTKLADHVSDRSAEAGSNVIDVLVSRLRRKLGVKVIETVRGQGYRVARDQA